MGGLFTYTVRGFSFSYKETIMFQKMTDRLHRLLGITGSMKSHRRTTPAERNAIQINLMATRFLDIGKTFFYGSTVAILVAVHMDKKPELILGLATLGAGIGFFFIGLICSGWYVENKTEPNPIPMQRGRKRRKRRR